MAVTAWAGRGMRQIDTLVELAQSRMYVWMDCTVLFAYVFETIHTSLCICVLPLAYRCLLSLWINDANKSDIVSLLLS